MLVKMKTSSFSYGGFYASGSKGRCRNMAASQSESKDSPKLIYIKDNSAMNANKSNEFSINTLRNFVLTVVSFSYQVIKFKHN